MPVIVDSWMETPDVLVFCVDDDPLYLGGINPAYQNESGTSYGTWVQRENRAKVGNPVEWCTVIGPNKDAYRFSSLPAASYVNRVALRDSTKYSITGGAGLTVTAAYYRNEAIDHGDYRTSSDVNLLTRWRMTVYLQLASPPVSGQQYTISHSDAAVDNFNFTFSDTSTRAGGIKVNLGGQNRNDAFKKAYLLSRLPGAPNHGVVDFASTYGINQYHIINSSNYICFTGNISLRLAWNQPDVGQGYDSGIDVGDIADVKTITGITKGNPTTIDCVAHGLVNGDKVRLFGITGIDSFETAIPTGEAGIWVGATVTKVNDDQITVNINSTSFSGTFSTTPDYSAALGGFANLLVKTFNTNRAATSVWEMDYSGWLAPEYGEYRIYIPTYGVSDPFRIDAASWNKIASMQHQGCYNLRLGCDVDRSGSYVRGPGLADGVGGCQNYYSTMVATFCSEGSQAYAPTGATVVVAGLGAYADGGAGALVSITRSGTTATATTTIAHGVPIGNTFFVTIEGATSGYNNASNAGDSSIPTSSGAPWLATSTGADTFTFGPVSGSLTTPAPTPGAYRSGFVTSTRATGSRGATQDAGDNDDLACDHLPGQKGLAWVFNELSPASRFTSFEVQPSTELLDPILFAGTDDLPPLFHELFWYSEQYRTQQDANGDILGGIGLGKFSSQIPSGGEPIDYYHGTDAGGNLAGQTVMGFWYAADHLTTASWCAAAAKLAAIAYGYGLTALGDAYRDSAVDAWDRVIAVMSDITTQDAHYITTLDLKAKMNWTEAQYREAVGTLSARALLQMYDAAGALYRLFGSVAGQTPYGDFIDNQYTISASVASGGSGYVVGDLIVLDISGAVNNPILRVTAVSGGAITSASVYYVGNFPTRTNPVSQLSTTGTGTGATFNLTITFTYASSMDQSFGAIDYYKTPGRKSAPADYFVTRINATVGANADVWIGPNTCFNNMINRNSTSGGTNFSGNSAIIAHAMLVAVNGVSDTTRSSKYLKSLQAGMSFILGANQPGRSFTRGIGARYTNCLLHEDTFKMGVAAPLGITPFGYFSWATSFMFNNFSVSATGSDGPLIFCAQNVTGDFEASTQKGSTKQWNPWRFGSGYWEWAPENHSIIFNSEFTLNTLPLYVAGSLYMSGWDGNAATEYGNQRFGWRP